MQTVQILPHFGKICDTFGIKRYQALLQILPVAAIRDGSKPPRCAAQSSPRPPVSHKVVQSLHLVLGGTRAVQPLPSGNFSPISLWHPRARQLSPSQQRSTLWSLAKTIALVVTFRRSVRTWTLLLSPILSYDLPHPMSRLVRCRDINRTHQPSRSRRMVDAWSPLMTTPRCWSGMSPRWSANNLLSRGGTKCVVLSFTWFC